MTAHYFSIAACNYFLTWAKLIQFTSSYFVCSELFIAFFHLHLGFPRGLCHSYFSFKFLYSLLISSMFVTWKITAINGKWFLLETLKTALSVAGVAVWRQHWDCTVLACWPLVPQILTVYFPRWSQWSTLFKLGKSCTCVDGWLEGILLQIQPRFVDCSTPRDSAVLRVTFLAFIFQK